MKSQGPSRTRNARRMADLGAKLKQLRGTRTLVDIAIEAGELAGEDLTEEWLKRLENGARVSVAPWEVSSLSAALVPQSIQHVDRRRRRAAELDLELRVLIGWAQPINPQD